MSNQITTFHDTSVGPKFLSISSEDLTREFKNALVSRGLYTDLQPIYNRHQTGVLLNAKIPEFSFRHEDSVYTPTVWAKNRNDGTCALSVGIGLFRSICLNGLYFGVSVFGGKVIHRVGQRTEDFIQQLPALINSGVDSIVAGVLQDTIVESAAQTVLNPFDIVGSLPGVTLAQKDALIAQIGLGEYRAGDRATDVWGLYNLVNETVRRSSKSALRSAERDMGLLEEITFLAVNQAA